LKNFGSGLPPRLLLHSGLGRSGFDLQVFNKGANLVKFTGLSIRGEGIAEQVEPLLINLHEGVINNFDINLDVRIGYFTTVLLSHLHL